MLLAHLCDLFFSLPVCCRETRRSERVQCIRIIEESRCCCLQLLFLIQGDLPNYRVTDRRRSAELCSAYQDRDAVHNVIILRCVDFFVVVAQILRQIFIFKKNSRSLASKIFYIYISHSYMPKCVLLQRHFSAFITNYN